MAEKDLHLQVMTIRELFAGKDHCTYEIPVYQRNYAWDEEQIKALVQDTYDAFVSYQGRQDATSPAQNKDNDKTDSYYLGTLVTYDRGDQRYEVIDGQQRLTTIYLILEAMDRSDSSVIDRLTYRARKKADATLKAIAEANTATDSIKTDRNVEEDQGIKNGFECAKKAIGEIVTPDEKEESEKQLSVKDFRAQYEDFFLDHVKLIRYEVPKDIDLNQYFEVMNSRGEQLEMHEIEKAKLMEKLDTDEEKKVFNRIWEVCSNMNVYIQQSLDEGKGRKIVQKIFGSRLCDFQSESFNDIVRIYGEEPENGGGRQLSILDMAHSNKENVDVAPLLQHAEAKDTFQPIIDFPNFLLIVLKITRMSEDDFKPEEFTLDDKALLHEFDNTEVDARQFAYNLLKARYYLDNYVVHHSREDDNTLSNPWKLQTYYYYSETGNTAPRNLAERNTNVQEELAMLLSMFEVSFTARQRKNYLFYCLLYLMQAGSPDPAQYLLFVRRLAASYFQNVYMDSNQLNERNVPKPRSFDQTMLTGRHLSDYLLDNEGAPDHKGRETFNRIFGNGAEKTKGIPLFVFNYLDYKIWKYYYDNIRGNEEKADSNTRKAFFTKLGCSDLDLRRFRNFYFSRTRRSLEHYFPQANVNNDGSTPSESQINCFGNFAMIGSEANSTGSNWSPKTKLDAYLDSSGKINPVSVASLKFFIMMQICKDQYDVTHKEEDCWTWSQIKKHQDTMVALLTEN